jgi:hypothetical protein
MQVTYTLTADDWIAYYARCWEAKWRGYALALRVMVLLVVIGLALAILAATSFVVFLISLYALSAFPIIDAALRDRSAIGVAAVFNIVALLTLGYVALRWNRRGSASHMPLRSRLWTWVAEREVLRAIRRKKIVTSLRYQLSIGSSGVAQVVGQTLERPAQTLTMRYERKLDWAAVQAVEVTASHVFFVTRDSGWLVVPRVAFPNEAAFQEFVGAAQGFLAPSPVTTAITAVLPRPRGSGNQEESAIRDGNRWGDA